MYVASNTASIADQYRALVDSLRGYRAAALQSDPLSELDAPADAGKPSASPWTPSSGSVTGATSIPMDTATQIYAQEFGTNAVDDTSSQSEIDRLRDVSTIGPTKMDEIRRQLNVAAQGFLDSYAKSHMTEWSAEADKLGIVLTNGSYESHFYDVPRSTSTGIDVAAGIPNSQAERIFRDIASPDDLAKFDVTMAPAMEQAQTEIRDQTLDVIKEGAAWLADFAPHMATLAAAGITPEDQGSIVLIRNPTTGRFIFAASLDSYTASHTPEELAAKATALENVVNNDPGLRAAYDAIADGDAPSEHISATMTPLSAPEGSDATIYASYQGVMDHLADGSMTPHEALAAVRQLAPEARGYRANVCEWWNPKASYAVAANRPVGAAQTQTWS